LSAAAVWVLAATMLAGPAAGAGIGAFRAVPVDAPEFQDVRTFLTSLGATPDVIAEVAGGTDADRLADWFRPDLTPPTMRPPGTDIATSAFFELETTKEIADLWRAPGGPLAAGSPGVIVAARPAARAAASEYYGYATTTAERPAPQSGIRVELGLAAFDSTPLAGGQATRWPAQHPGDFFAGFNVAWSVRAESGAPFSLLHFQNRAGAGWGDASTDAIALLIGRTLIVLIPASESDGFVDGRAFGFTGSSTETAIDVWPELKAPAKPYAGTAILEITTPPVRVTPTPATTPTPNPAATPSPSPAATPTPTSIPGAATPTPTPSGGVSQDSTALLVAVIVVGLVVVLVGVLMRSGRRGGRPSPPPPS
jgi:hypothetical protein